jgi:hypothetical protein
MGKGDNLFTRKNLILKLKYLIILVILWIGINHQFMMIFFNNDVINNDINDSDDIINDVLVDKLEVKYKENIKGA